jgi:hypothetical protein
MICVPLVLGVLVRVKVPNFLAADLSFETTVLLGVLVGPLAAMGGGAALAVPALLHHEYWTLPVNLAVAAVAGAFGRFADREDVWSFSPMIDLSIYRWVTRNIRRPHLDRQVLLLVLIAGMQFCASMLSRFYPRRYFCPALGGVVGGAADLCERADCGGDSAEDMELGAGGAEAGGAGKAAAGGEAGCAAAADQSALFV